MVSASFCGGTTIPFSYEAPPSAQPVGECFGATCFSSNPNGYPSAIQATSYRTKRQADNSGSINEFSGGSIGPSDFQGQTADGTIVVGNQAASVTPNTFPPGQPPTQDFGFSVSHIPQDTSIPPSSYNYFPMCSPGMSGDFFCFSADTLVELASGKLKRMDALNIDDWVLSATDKEFGYSVVESWIHRMPEVNAEFIKFTLEDGKVLKITNKHFIYRGDCSNAGGYTDFNRASSDMVYAEEVGESDCLFVRDNNKFIEKRITGIDYVREKGIYAPMTSSTNIIVNSIHASCFNIIRNKGIQNTFSVSLQRWASSLIGQFFREKSEETDGIELVPGMQTLVQILSHIVPIKF